MGKGSVYLYWSTKEDLPVGLFGRDLLARLEEVRAVLAGEAGPRAAQPPDAAGPPH
ncbi:hypothetical protein [Halostreptopolyspora alba]|uniref:hypothetical protein n=1 Tax=Halostreptopolyspora alba TaxID=2487137 RepID=UPI00370FF2D4